MLAALIVPGGAGAQSVAQATPPSIVAKAAVVVEYPSGRILYQKNLHRRLPEASTTKTMTALVTLQRVALTDVVTTTADDLVGESSMGLWEGETQTVSSLLYGLMLPSGNDAAMALARHVGEGLKEPADQPPVERFVGLMNREAQQMGLADTHFRNPHGLDDPNHYTTAYDLASITWYDLHNPVFNEIVKQVYYNAPGHALKNTNEMLTRYEGADGVKTGMTDAAGNCLVTSATRNGRRLISVVLGEEFGHTYPDTAAILDYGFAQPADDARETLTVARRSQLLWYLSSALPTPLPTPRVPPTPPPTPTSAGILNLSGLLASAKVPPNAPPGVGPVDRAPAPAKTDLTGWLWPLLALPVGGLLLFFSRRWGGSGRAVAPVAAPVEGVAPNMTAAEMAVAPAPVPAAKPGRGSTKRAMPPSPPRRVSLMDGEDPASRAQRAVALAYRGQEGSSLAEFMMVVKQNPDFEFSSIANFYDMPAAGYLALARAYLQHDRARYAAALIKLARETYPDDRPLMRIQNEIDGLTAGETRAAV